MKSGKEIAFSFDSYRYLLSSRIAFPQTKDRFLVVASEVSPWVILAPLFWLITATIIFILFFYLAFFVFLRRANQKIQQKEEALLTSEERFRRAIMVAGFPIMLHAEDGEVIQINEVWEEITGYTHSEIPTISDWTQKAYGHSSPTVKSDIDKLYSLEARKEEGEYLVTAKDGSKHLWDFNTAPLGRLSDGRRLMVSMARDITEKRLAEEQYKTMIQTSMDGFWITDTQTHIIDVNDAYCRLTGYTRDELITMNISDFEALETPEETARHIQMIIESGHARFETQHRCKDGRLVDIDISCNFLPVDGGRVFVFLRDITERKKAEAKLREANELLRNRTAELELFNRAMVDREQRIIEIKEEVNALCQELGREPKYPPVWRKGSES